MGAVTALLLIFSMGCATNTAYRQALNDRDTEIRGLREERSSLKNQLRDLQNQATSLETALSEANARLARQPEPVIPAAPPRVHSELENLGITTSQRNGATVITVPSQITFPSGKAELTKSGREAIGAVARVLQQDYPDGDYWIEGHTDSDPIVKSRFPTNRDLSLARAMAVLHALVEDAGLPDDSFIVVGWGEYQPLVANNSDANKAKNRRVEIVVNRPQ
jgi:chemotaxis protein MotB